MSIPISHTSVQYPNQTSFFSDFPLDMMGSNERSNEINSHQMSACSLPQPPSQTPVSFDNGRLSDSMLTYKSEPLNAINHGYEGNNSICTNADELNMTSRDFVGTNTNNCGCILNPNDIIPCPS